MIPPVNFNRDLINDHTNCIPFLMNKELKKQTNTYKKQTILGLSCYGEEIMRCCWKKRQSFGSGLTEQDTNGNKNHTS